MANLSANETALQAELYFVRREAEALRDDNHALRCYLKSADKQVEEACKKADFYMDEVIILRAENEALKKMQWISVDDRLPNHGFVLVYRPSDTLTKIATIKYDAVMERFGGKSKVTHWLPLPQPPSQTDKG